MNFTNYFIWSNNPKKLKNKNTHIFQSTLFEQNILIKFLSFFNA